MNIRTLTSPKTYNNNYLNDCPTDDPGLLKYSSSPPSNQLMDKSSPVRSSTSSSSQPPANYSGDLVLHQQQSHQYQQQTQQNVYSNNDLQSVVLKYHANPELLKLILASKVEEDKRRTEEAKLKAKELDLYFQTQQHEMINKDSLTNRNSLTLQHQNQQKLENRRRRSSCSSTSSAGSLTANTLGTVDSIHRRIAPYAIPRPISMNNNNNSSSSSSNMIPRRNSSVSSTSYNMNRLSLNNTISSSNSNNKISQQHQPQQYYPSENSNTTSSAPSASSHYLYSMPSSIRSSADNKTVPNSSAPPVKISRRRRSMQAITKLVETTENSYDDGHFWKNNGNTVQKKTGCKSIYYKCANSSKGCPVNKTVVEQPDRSYLIKYRGDHISECSQVEYIRDL